ncbi:4-hydroxy-2-oxovalerate aldolase [compost metagenome]
MDAADEVEKEFVNAPLIKSSSIVSGLTGVFSGFAKPVERIAQQYNVDPKDIYFELGRRKVVAGQEDLIIEVAIGLSQLR